MNEPILKPGGTLQGERKRVTVMFADLSGFTALTEHCDAEEVVVLVNQCLADISECVYRYGGTVDKYIGDGVMALFGAPRAHEDDPERAIRAALDMHEVLVAFRSNPALALSRSLDVHVGIATGDVIAGLIGTERRRDYTVMGRAANLASRLEDLADRGQIFVSEDTYRLTNHLFTFRELEPAIVKGMTGPVKIYEVLGLQTQPGSTRGLGGSQYPMVDRHVEAHKLSLAVNRLRRGHRGHGGIVIVEGDAGIGKSRLVAEVRNKAHAIASDLNWLEGRGLSYGFSLNYHLLAGMLRDYLGVTDDSDETHAITKLRDACADMFGARADQIAPYLGILLGFRLPEDMAEMIPQANPNLLQMRVFTAYGDWVSAVAAREPLVLAFDDLHWADPNSMALIEHLMSLCPHHPILILCVSRPDRDSPFWAVRQHALSNYAENVTLIHLGPLSDNEILTLINSFLALDYMPSEIEYTILSRAEGNPLFVEEILRNFVDVGTLVERDGIWRATWPVVLAEIPETLQGMLAARLDRLDEATKRVVQIAAVIGRTFLRSVLARVVDDPSTLDDCLTQLQSAEIIRQQSAGAETEYTFKHILTQEAAYQSLLTQQRKIYHHRVADTLARLFWERGEEYAGAGLVAAHYERAEVWPRALRYMERAGDAAHASFANKEAVNHYTRALQITDRLPARETLVQRLTLHQKRGNLLAALGDVAAALDDYEKVRELSNLVCDQQAELHALNQIGALQFSLHNCDQAGEYFNQALNLARILGDQAGIADSLNRLGRFYCSSGQLEDARLQHSQASEIANKLEDKALLAASLEGLGQVDLMRGHLCASFEKIAQVVQLRRWLVDRIGLMEALSALAAVSIWQGDYRRAADACLEGFEFISRVGDLPVVSSLHTWFAISQLNRGDLETVEAHLQTGLEVARRLDYLNGQIQSHIGLGYYYMAVAQLDTALETIQKAAALAPAAASTLVEAQVRTCQAAVHLERGQAEQALDTLRVATVYRTTCEADNAPGRLMALYEQGRAGLILGRWDTANQALQQISDTPEFGEFREYQMRGCWLRGVLALEQKDPDSALGWLEDACTQAEAIKARPILWRIEMALGDAHHLAGRGPQAGHAYQRAWEILESVVNTLPNQATRSTILGSPAAARLRARVEIYG